MSVIPEPGADGIRLYGRYNRREDSTRCIVTVFPTGGWSSAQCSRKRGHGPDRLYCKQHDPDAEKARREKALAERTAKNRVHAEEFRLKAAAPALLAALRKIAQGHNDPRNLATDTLYELKYPVREKTEAAE